MCCCYIHLQQNFATTRAEKCSFAANCAFFFHSHSVALSNTASNKVCLCTQLHQSTAIEAANAGTRPTNDFLSAQHLSALAQPCKSSTSHLHRKPSRAIRQPLSFPLFFLQLTHAHRHTSMPQMQHLISRWQQIC